MLVELGSFDAIIGMDWLAKYQAVIVCAEKIARIPWGNETLIILDDGSNQGNATRLNIILVHLKRRCKSIAKKGVYLSFGNVTAQEEVLKTMSRVKSDLVECTAFSFKTFLKYFLKDLPGLLLQIRQVGVFKLSLAPWCLHSEDFSHTATLQSKGLGAVFDAKRKRESKCRCDADERKEREPPLKSSSISHGTIRLDLPKQIFKCSDEARKTIRRNIKSEILAMDCKPLMNSTEELYDDLKRKTNGNSKSGIKFYAQSFAWEKGCDRMGLEKLLTSLNLPEEFGGRLHCVEEPVEIVGREVKRLKRSRIPLVKVRWNSKRGPEFTLGT
ncbi:hypothetical protein Tco_0006321 [Tanacetum coccineum]